MLQAPVSGASWPVPICASLDQVYHLLRQISLREEQRAHLLHFLQQGQSRGFHYLQLPTHLFLPFSIAGLGCTWESGVLTKLT
jgi:hypothetical protein